MLLVLNITLEMGKMLKSLYCFKGLFVLPFPFTGCRFSFTFIEQDSGVFL